MPRRAANPFWVAFRNAFTRLRAEQGLRAQLRGVLEAQGLEDIVHLDMAAAFLDHVAFTVSFTPSASTSLQIVS